MAVSPGGLGTLLALILIGPVIYSGRYVWKKLGFVTLTKYLRRPRRTEGEEVEGLNEGNGEEDDDHKLTTNEYLFAMVGYAIGIGNVWRFPYVIATNGGSAALLAYIICAIFVAVRSIISHIQVQSLSNLWYFLIWNHPHTTYASPFCTLSHEVANVHL